MQKKLSGSGGQHNGKEWCFRLKSCTLCEPQRPDSAQMINQKVTQYGYPYSIVRDHLFFASLPLSIIHYSLQTNRFSQTVHSMALPVMEFQDQGYKIRKVLYKNQHTQRKLLNFENWTNWEPQQLVKIRIFQKINKRIVMFNLECSVSLDAKKKSSA